jgi:hypothetical protein
MDQAPGTGNREQGVGSREQGIWNREQEIGNGEQAIGKCEWSGRFTAASRIAGEGAEVTGH